MERGDAECLPGGGDINLRTRSRSRAHTKLQGQRITSNRKVTGKDLERGMVWHVPNPKKKKKRINEKNGVGWLKHLKQGKY